jgi:hypothetical protein
MFSLHFPFQIKFTTPFVPIFKNSSTYVTVLGRELKPEPSEAGADDELDLEDTTTTSSSLELPMFFLQVRKKACKKVLPIRIRIILGTRIRFPIKVKSRIRNRIRFKNQKLWRLKMAVDAHNRDVEAQNCHRFSSL